MKAVESLLGSMNVASDDLAIVVREVLDAKHTDPVAVLREIEWVTSRTLSTESRSMLIRRAAKGEVDLDWVRRTQLTDGELDFMGRETYTSWKEFESASDISSRRAPGRLAERPPKDHGVGASAKVRGIAGEMVAAETELPHGLKIKRKLASDSKASSTDYELTAPDGSLAELEVKAQRPENWKNLLDDYDAEVKSGVAPKKESQVSRLVKQIEAGHARGRKVYVAISDGTPALMRQRLLSVLERVGLETDQLMLLSESEIKRVGKQLRDHMRIPQPGGKPAPIGDIE